MKLMMKRVLLLLLVAGCGAAPQVVCSTDAGPAPTYDSFGQQFLSKYCIGCHNPQRKEHGVDVSTQALAHGNADDIVRAAGTGRSMPPSGSLQPSDVEREQLSQWLACGTE